MRIAAYFPRLRHRADLRTLGFMAAVSIATGILFGLAPALRATRITLAETLKDAGRSAAGNDAGDIASG